MCCVMFRQLARMMFLFAIAFWYNQVAIIVPQVDAQLGIINGEAAPEGKWPFMVSLQFQINKTENWWTFCGGSIVNDDSILTAAHCFVDKTWLNESVVYVGHVNAFTPDSKYQYPIAKFTPHPDYRKVTNTGTRNDVAVVKLGRKINFSELKGMVAKICLPCLNDEPVVEKCIAMGWGQISVKPLKVPSILQQANLPILPHALCEKIFPGYDKDGYYCAGSTNKTVCAGDSGTPLVCLSKSDPDVYIQYGIGSFTKQSCNVPGFYTKTAIHVKWIAQNAEN